MSGARARGVEAEARAARSEGAGEGEGEPVPSVGRWSALRGTVRAGGVGYSGNASHGVSGRGSDPGRSQIREAAFRKSCAEYKVGAGWYVELMLYGLGASAGSIGDRKELLRVLDCSNNASLFCAEVTATWGRYKVGAGSTHESNDSTGYLAVHSALSPEEGKISSSR
jgi:hypothetical protein